MYTLQYKKRGKDGHMIIVTDSCCDFSLDDAASIDVIMLSLKVSFGEDTFEDKRTIQPWEFYERLDALDKDEELPKTSLVNISSFLEVFEAHPDEDIVTICVSSKLSGTYNAAVNAQLITGRDNIYVIDSTTISCGMAMLVIMAAKMRDEGVSANEIAKTIEELGKRVKIYAIVDSLKCLVKGGRLSAMVGAVASALSIKPVTMLTEGAVEMTCMGRNTSTAIKALMRYIANKCPMDTSMPVSFSHTGDLKGLRMLQAEAGYPDEKAYWLGSVVGTHCGPGTLVIAYFMAQE